MSADWRGWNRRMDWSTFIAANFETGVWWQFSIRNETRWSNGFSMTKLASLILPVQCIAIHLIARIPFVSSLDTCTTNMLFLFDVKKKELWFLMNFCISTEFMNEKWKGNTFRNFQFQEIVQENIWHDDDEPYQWLIFLRILFVFYTVGSLHKFYKFSTEVVTIS